MLQQTTVVTVIPYYRRFLDSFPTVEALADAPLDDVLRLWAGLGYYSRARNLHACAVAVTKRGGFPSDPTALQALPGIGPYTARAIAAIAFGVPVVPVDGNVERVTARLAAVTAPLPGARALLARLAGDLNVSPEAQARPSDFAQALFDLGATLCTPRAPACLNCPWRENCLGLATGAPALLPARAPKKERPVRYGAAFRVVTPQGKVLLRRRPPSGLLGGMDELPGTPWRDTPWTDEEALAHAPDPTGSGQKTAWTFCGEVKHVFTHFTLRLLIYRLPDYHLPVSQGPGTQGAQLEATSLSDLAYRELDTAVVSGVLKKCLSVSNASQADQTPSKKRLNKKSG